MASEYRFCAGCLRDDEHNAAESWCVECQEEVCKTCSKTHKRLKPPHKVLSLSEADVFSSGLIITNCNDHPDRKVSFFCPYHDVIICDSCLADDHKNCHGVLPLDKAARNVRGSFVFEDVQSRMRDLSTVLSKINDIQTKHLNKLDLDQIEENAIKDITQIKETIVQKLDKVEKESIYAVRNELKVLREKGKQLIHEIGSNQKFVSECIKNITALNTSASEQQLFQAVKMMDKRTHEIESFVQSKLKKTSRVEFQLNEEAKKQLTSFDSFGRLALSEKEIELPMLKQVQAPISATDSGKFRLLHKFQTSILNPKVEVRRGCIAGNKLLLTASKEPSIYVCNLDGTDVKCISLESNPFETGIVDTTHAIVTMRSKGYYILNTGSLSMSDLKKPGSYAMSCNNDQIYVYSGNNTIMVINEKGYIQKTLKIKTNPDFIHYSLTKNFYYTTVDDDDIFQVTSSGETNTFFKHPELERPRGMATDMSGNLYVVGGRSYNIFKISENGKSHQILLNKGDGVRYADGLHFDINSKRLFISNCHGTEVLIFQLD